jgi:hypothetical protein
VGVPASTALSVPWNKPGAIKRFGGIGGARRAPPENVGDNVGAYVVGSAVGGLVSPTLVGGGVGAVHTRKRVQR